MTRRRASRTGRNGPCPCGSGRKYKNCHLRPGTGARDRRAIAADAWRKGRAAGECIHPAAPGACEGPTIEAHSVQRSRGLSRIARDGHVLIFTPQDPFAFRRSGGQFEPNLVGVRDATTFRGFCARHDNSTFSPVEDRPLVPSQEQLCLLAYRAFAYEFAAKKALLLVIEASREPDYRRPIPDEAARQEILTLREQGVRQGLDDLLESKQRFDTVLRGGLWGDLRHLAIRVAPIPPVLVSGVTLPEFDFAGRALQDLATVETAEPVFVSIVPGDDDDAVAALSWFPEHQAPARLLETLRRLDATAMPDALLRLLFGSFENVPISPAWWDALDDATQRRIGQRFRANVADATSPDFLVEDGLRIAPFSVSGVENVAR